MAYGGLKVRPAMGEPPSPAKRWILVHPLRSPVGVSRGAVSDAEPLLIGWAVGCGLRGIESFAGIQSPRF